MKHLALVRAAATTAVAGLALVCANLVLSPGAQADLGDRVHLEAPPPDWTPPTWHPEPEALLGLPGMDARSSARGPRLRSPSVFVYDLDAGEVLVERGAENRRPVASLTKLVSALAMSSEPVDLTRTICVDELFWPSRSGARSKFSTGECYLGWDLLGSALVASDNRAAYGLAVQSGLDYYQFLGRMDEISAQLGMEQSSWADPSGLEDDNLSTARDMSKAAVAVATHPTLSLAASARTWHVEKVKEIGVGPRERLLRTTNRASGRSDLEFLAAKTGYTDTARYCFTGVLRTDEGRTLAVTLLGAPRSRDRWSDLDRVLRWVEG
jgi:D-alanyl-D-alanine endopeptidase (penicillin-binding protein 7)